MAALMAAMKDPLCLNYKLLCGDAVSIPGPHTLRRTAGSLKRGPGGAAACVLLCKAAYVAALSG